MSTWISSQVNPQVSVSIKCARAFIDVPIWKPFHWLFRIEALRVKNYERKILQLFDHILVTCEDEIEIIDNLVSEASIFKVPNGVNYPNKIEKTTQGKTLYTKVARVANKLYRPLAHFRMKKGISALLVEYWLYRRVTQAFAFFQSKLVGVRATVT